MPQERRNSDYREAGRRSRSSSPAPRRRRSAARSASFAVLYAVAVIGVSALLACVGWIAASDVLALNKEEHSVTVTITPEDSYDDVVDMLKEAVQSGTGTKAKISSQVVAGKTGTAEHTDKGDDAWFVCYAPYDDPKYVVATVIEQGGGGSAVAAPVGAKVMEAVMAADAGSNDASSMGRIAGSSGRQIEGFSTKSASRSD